MHNAITVGRLPKYTVFLHGYTYFIHEWVTFGVSHHRGLHHETSKGAKGYGGHAFFKYNIHVVGFVETSGGLRKSCGIIIIESESQLLCELETEYMPGFENKSQLWHDHPHCSLTLGAKLQLFFKMTVFFFIFPLSCFFSKGALDQGCRTALAGWTGTQFFFSLHCQTLGPAWMQTHFYYHAQPFADLQLQAIQLLSTPYFLIQSTQLPIDELVKKN